MNYRKFYKNYYGISFGKEYDIHHIDGNTENNNIKNLVLLPAQLHKRYHALLNVFSEPICGIVGRFGRAFDFSVNSDCMFAAVSDGLSNLANVCAECQQWYLFKMQMDYDVEREGKVNAESSVLRNTPGVCAI